LKTNNLAMSFAICIEHNNHKIRRDVQGITTAEQLRHFILAQLQVTNHIVQYFDHVFQEFIPLEDLQFITNPVRVRVIPQQNTTPMQLQESKPERATTPQPVLFVQQIIPPTTPTKIAKPVALTPKKEEIIEIASDDDEVIVSPSPKNLKRNLSETELTPNKRVRVDSPDSQSSIPRFSMLSPQRARIPSQQAIQPALARTNTSGPSKTRMLILKRDDTTYTPALVFPELNNHMVKQMLHDGLRWWILTTQGLVFISTGTTVMEHSPLSALIIDQMGISTSHKLFLTKNSKVYGCGAPIGLGLTQAVPDHAPILLQILDDMQVTSLSCGIDFSIFVANKRLYGMGLDDHRQLGDDCEPITKIPRELGSSSFLQHEYATEVKCGASHTAVFTSVGYVHVFGRIGGKDKAMFLMSFNVRNFSVAKEAVIACTNLKQGLNSAYAVGKNENSRLGITVKNASAKRFVKLPEQFAALFAVCSDHYTVMKGKGDTVIAYGCFGSWFDNAMGHEIQWRKTQYFGDDIQTVSKMGIRTIGVSDQEIVIVLEITNEVRGNPI
jgi:hypothetical protein